MIYRYKYKYIDILFYNLDIYNTILKIAIFIYQDLKDINQNLSTQSLLGYCIYLSKKLYHYFIVFILWFTILKRDNWI